MLTYATDLSSAMGRSLPDGFDPGSAALRGLQFGESLSLMERRRLFHEVTEQLETLWELKIDPTVAAQHRTAALFDTGFDVDGKLVTSIVPAAPGSAPLTQRFVDVELVAIYW